jgi:hypothetical protein
MDFFSGNSSTDTEVFPRGELPAEPFDPREEVRLWKRR